MPRATWWTHRWQRGRFVSVDKLPCPERRVRYVQVQLRACQARLQGVRSGRWHCFCGSQVRGGPAMIDLEVAVRYLAERASKLRTPAGWMLLALVVMLLLGAFGRTLMAAAFGGVF